MMKTCDRCGDMAPHKRSSQPQCDDCNKADEPMIAEYYKRLASAQKSLDRFDNAVRQHEMLGSKLPEERPEIEREYKLARQAMMKLLRQAVQ